MASEQDSKAIKVRRAITKISNEDAGRLTPAIKAALSTLFMGGKETLSKLHDFILARDTLAEAPCVTADTAGYAPNIVDLGLVLHLVEAEIASGKATVRSLGMLYLFALLLNHEGDGPTLRALDGISAAIRAHLGGKSWRQELTRFSKVQEVAWALYEAVDPRCYHIVMSRIECELLGSTPPAPAALARPEVSA